MPQITYIDAAGHAATHNLPEGWNLMLGAINNGVDGIIGECGGSCTCATCHCYVDAARLGDLPPVGEAEAARLEFVAAGRRPNSRLAGRIKSTSALEGLVLHLPETQHEPASRPQQSLRG